MLRMRLLILLLLPLALSAQTGHTQHAKQRWVDSILSTMSIQEQLAQSFMVAAWSNKGADHLQEIENDIIKYRIGGLIFFQGDPLKQAFLTN